jgi:formylglycine-generating enzyme required for sulfatase activity
VQNSVPDITWCPIPPGDFIMGEGKQQRTISLDAFAISKHPITNAQFDAFVQDGGYSDKQWRSCWTKDGLRWKGDRTGLDRYGGVFDLPNHPVVIVTWYEAVAFCSWLGQKLGQQVSLPTEEQWERAARHTDGRTYPWGAMITPDHANTIETGIGSTTTVGIFPKGMSVCGALDLSGNVWERCLNEYRNPERVQLDGDEPRVVRGGSWVYDRDFAAAPDRDDDRPDNRFYDLGFRVVVVGWRPNAQALASVL